MNKVLFAAVMIAGMVTEKANATTFGITYEGACTGTGSFTAQTNGPISGFLTSMQCGTGGNFVSYSLDQNMVDFSYFNLEFLHLDLAIIIDNPILTFLTGGTASENTSNYYGNTSFELISGTLRVSAVPVPAALPLLASGLGALGVIGWRRKRNAASAA